MSGGHLGGEPAPSGAKQTPQRTPCPLQLAADVGAGHHPLVLLAAPLVSEVDQLLHLGADSSEPAAHVGGFEGAGYWGGLAVELGAELAIEDVSPAAT